MNPTPISKATGPEVPRQVSAIDWSSWAPVDRATLLFVIVDGSILLIRKKRGLGQGKINGPGGRLEAGETPLEGALREVREEVCVEARQATKCGELYFQFVDGYSIHVHVFRAAALVGEAQETPEAVPLWVGLDAIPYDEMWADDRLWIPHMLDDQPFEGYFIFDDDTMVDQRLDLLETGWD